MKDNTYIVEFSGENAGASAQELLSVMRNTGEFSIEHLDDDFSIVRGTVYHIKDCAFVNRLSAVVDESDDYMELSGTGLPPGSFYLRIVDPNGCHNTSTEPQLGRQIRDGRVVSFSSPDFLVRAYHFDKWYLTLVTYERDKKEMEKRRAPLRPFFSPIAIHPKYARYLVNITGTRRGDTVLDPFCGTGGILLEAGLMGRRIIGNDFSLNMVKGARLNLKYFNLKDFKIMNRDIADLEIEERVDAIATDLPYGRNSNMLAESITSLYRTAFLKFHELLKPDSTSSIVLSDTGLLKHAEGLFSIGRIVGIPQHRSLTRYFVTISRKG